LRWLHTKSGLRIRKVNGQLPVWETAYALRNTITQKTGIFSRMAYICSRRSSSYSIWRELYLYFCCILLRNSAGKNESKV